MIREVYKYCKMLSVYFKIEKHENAFFTIIQCRWLSSIETRKNKEEENEECDESIFLLILFLPH